MKYQDRLLVAFFVLAIGFALVMAVSPLTRQEDDPFTIRVFNGHAQVDPDYFLAHAEMITPADLQYTRAFLEKAIAYSDQCSRSAENLFLAFGKQTEAARKLAWQDLAELQKLKTTAHDLAVPERIQVAIACLEDLNYLELQYAARRKYEHFRYARSVLHRIRDRYALVVIQHQKNQLQAEAGDVKSREKP